MYLIKKGTLEFTKILASNYKIKEGNNTISKKQMVNGKRKKIITNYEDCIIKINLGGLDNTDFEDYYNALTDGAFTYYSLKDMEYKTANFLVEKPEISVNKMLSASNYLIDNVTVTLEKSSDIT